MKKNILSIDDVMKAHPLGERRESMPYKFVRLANGKYIFTCVAIACLDHAQMVDKDDEPVTAGTILVARDHWSIITYISSTLGLHVDGLDEDNLTKLLGRPNNGW